MNQNKINIPIAIVLSAVIIGGFVYAAQVNKQKSAEKQLQQLEQGKREAEEKAQQEKKQAELEAIRVAQENAPDTIPPKIESFCFGTLQRNEERVCIEIGTWSGYLDSVNSMPITGKIEGKIKSITVDGKKISWDQNNQIYQRINLYVYGGLNKYKVIAEDMHGNVSIGYVQTTAENTSNDLNINLDN